MNSDNNILFSDSRARRRWPLSRALGTMCCEILEDGERANNGSGRLTPYQKTDLLGRTAMNDYIPRDPVCARGKKDGV